MRIANAMQSALSYTDALWPTPGTYPTPPKNTQVSNDFTFQCSASHWQVVDADCKFLLCKKPERSCGRIQKSHGYVFRIPPPAHVFKNLLLMC